jgi:hypothetical protein
MLADPDDFGSWQAGIFWAKFADQAGMGKVLLVPMDNRTTAAPNGFGDYVFYRQGGWSWCVPYIAGVYAMAVQVDPTVTPDRFWKLAMKTGRTIETQNLGKPLKLGPIVDPAALIAALEAERDAAKRP